MTNKQLYALCGTIALSAFAISEVRGMAFIAIAWSLCAIWATDSPADKP